MFAAGERAAKLGAPLAQHRKKRVHPLLVFPDARPVPAQIGAHEQVFLHGQTRKDHASLGHLGDAERNDALGGQARDVFAEKPDGALARRRDPRDGHKRGGLAGAIGPDQGHDLALPDAQAHALEGLDVAVKGLDVRDLKHVPRPCRGRPR